MSGFYKSYIYIKTMEVICVVDLSYDIISQFAKVVNKDKKQSSETTVYGTIRVDGNGKKCVQLDGSDHLTPLYDTDLAIDFMTATAKKDDRVSVLIKDHTATVTGNLTSPATNSDEVEDRINEFNTIVVGQVNANAAHIERLQANKADVGELEAAEAKITKLESEKANIKDLDVTYANIDFTNIDKATMGYFYAQSGLIKDVVVGEQTITGKLVGVTISGDLLEGNTVVAEKLVIKGSDGLYYKLNTDGIKVEAEQTDYNSINGSVIKAKSITATKISVSDLVAFDATIGGFNITDSSIYSGTKESVDNTTRGIYLDKDGQMAIGDTNNFIKYYKDTDGSYKLAISAKSISISSGTDVETAINNVQNSVDNLEIGGRNLLRNTSNPINTAYWRHTNITSDQSLGENVFYITTTTASEVTAATKNIRVEGGKTYTISLFVNASSNIVDIDLYFLSKRQGEGSDFTIIQSSRIPNKFSDGWHKIEWTFVMDPNAYEGYVRVDNNGSKDGTTSTLKYTNLKMERGSKATDYSPAVEDITDSVEIGGRNLLRNTKAYDVSGDSSFSGEMYKDLVVRYLDCTDLNESSFKEHSQFSGSINPEPGAQYTFSFYAKGTRLGTHFYDGGFKVIQSVSSQGEIRTSSDGNMGFALTNEWKRYWVTYTLENTNTLTTSGNKHLLIRVWGGHEAYVCGCMFEKSNKPSDWSPAPEDVQNGIDDASKTATNFLNFDSTGGLEVGNRIGGAWSGFRAQIRNAAFNILAESGAVIASYGAKLIELGKNATDSIIKLCGGKGTIEYDTEDDCLQLSADNIRLKGVEMASLYSNYTDSNGIFRNGAVHASPGNVQVTAGGGSDNSSIHVNPTNIQMATKNFYIAGVLNDSTNGGVYVAVNDGTSGIWTFRQYSNGMVELWGTYNVSNLDCTTAMGSMYRTAVFNPTAFPFTVYNPNLTASYESDGYGAFLWATTTTTTAKPPSYYLVRATSATIVKGEINFHVYGKWKQ